MFRLHDTTAVCLTTITLFSGLARADEFRVESKVFQGDQARPVSESLTLFYEGRAYDLLSSPPEITVLDLAERRIMLLDPTRKVRTELNTDRLTTFVEQLRVRASRQADPMLKFAAQPNFDESVEDDGRLSFASSVITYKVRGSRASDAAAVQAYREFADWTQRLKTRVQHGALPPFPRLAVNAALERRRLLPDEVELTISDPNRPRAKPVVLRSEHKFESQLYPADRKRIEEAKDYAANFKLVTLEEYLPPPMQARR